MDVTEFEWQRGAAATSVKEANTRFILEQEGEDFDMCALLEQAATVDMSDAPVYVSPQRQDASSREEAEGDAEALSHEPAVPQVAPSDDGDPCAPGSPLAMGSQAQGSAMHTHEMYVGKAGRTASSASKASQGSATTTVRPALAVAHVTPLPAACGLLLPCQAIGANTSRS